MCMHYLLTLKTSFSQGKRSVNRKAQSSSRNSYTEVIFFCMNTIECIYITSTYITLYFICIFDMQSIQRLQQRLRSLEAERRGGSMRPIDDVDAEIAQVQKEISSLKWASWGLSR